MVETATPDYKAITLRQQKVWSSGDFAKIGTRSVIVGEMLCESVGLRPGARVLDVAAGSGNTALAAARRWCEVTASDYVPQLLETARRRAECEGLPLKVELADAQSLPFDDASFDVVLSSFGAMFAPDQEKTAAELLRVCRPGGQIGMANWTPDSLVGDIFRVTAKYVPPPSGLRPAVDWGREDRLRELLGTQIDSLQLFPRDFKFCYYSVEHMLEYFRSWYGPTASAFNVLDGSGQEKLAHDLLVVYQKYNQSGNDTLVATGAYVEVVAVRT